MKIFLSLITTILLITNIANAQVNSNPTNSPGSSQGIAPLGGSIGGGNLGAPSPMGINNNPNVDPNVKSPNNQLPDISSPSNKLPMNQGRPSDQNIYPNPVGNSSGTGVNSNSNRSNFDNSSRRDY